MDHRALRFMGLVFISSAVLILGAWSAQAQTPDQVAKFGGSGGLVDSAITETNGDVRIGSLLSRARLDVEGGQRGAAVITNNGGNGLLNPTLSVLNMSGATESGIGLWVEAGGTDTAVIIGARADGDFIRAFRSGGDLRFRLLNDGGFIAMGPKSAVVETASFGKRLLYAMESPQNWFEDFGKARLVKGQANVRLDPIFLETVNTMDDYHVFLTARGNCKGLYVANQTSTSFEVMELQHGKSDIAFDYRIVAKRKGYEQTRLTELKDIGDSNISRVKLAGFGK